jgi:hypothetical protein
MLPARAQACTLTTGAEAIFADDEFEPVIEAMHPHSRGNLGQAGDFRVVRQ